MFFCYNLNFISNLQFEKIEKFKIYLFNYNLNFDLELKLLTYALW